MKDTRELSPVQVLREATTADLASEIGTARSVSGSGCGAPPADPSRGRHRGARALSVARAVSLAKGGRQVQGERHIRDLSTSNSAHGEDGSKPCSISQRAAPRLRQDHHARITSISMSVP
jgi:hypothetical protein